MTTISSSFSLYKNGVGQNLPTLRLFHQIHIDSYLSHSGLDKWEKVTVIQSKKLATTRIQCPMRDAHHIPTTGDPLRGLNIVYYQKYDTGKK